MTALVIVAAILSPSVLFLVLVVVRTHRVERAESSVSRRRIPTPHEGGGAPLSFLRPRPTVDGHRLRRIQ